VHFLEGLTFQLLSPTLSRSEVDMRQERVHTLRSEWGAVMLFVRLFVGDGVNEGRQLALAPGVIKLQTCVALCLFSLSISLFPPPV